MKDKVSPMRDSDARSVDSTDATGNKHDVSNDFIKADLVSTQVRGKPWDKEDETNPGTDNHGDTSNVRVTDLTDLPVITIGHEETSESKMANSLPSRVSGEVSKHFKEPASDCASVTTADGSEKRKTRNVLTFPKKNSKGFARTVNHWSKLRTAIQTTNAVKMKTKRKGNLNRQDSFLKKFSTRQHRGDSDCEMPDEDDVDYKWQNQNVVCAVIHPDGTFMFYWLSLVTLAVLYNWWTCIAREGFREIQDGWEALWFTFDAACDTVYLLDIVVQFRTGYLEQGLMVYDAKKLFRKYFRSSNFYYDITSLFPLDLIQIFIGIHPMIRFPRFLKTYRTLRFMYMLESRAAYPNLFRVANLTHVLFLGSHWFAAFYYLISEAEGFVGDWAYPPPTGEFASVTRKYLMSLYWSTLTLTTIGDLPKPDSNWEYVFVIVSYLIGVFVFATIVGQVGNVITNRNASRQEFEKLLDGAKSYMRTHNVPPDLQKRVQRWYDYVWSRGRLNGSWDINSLGLLPDKLKTELALNVNLETLKMVTIFQECQPEFLHDLVLKMKAYIFTPGDLICRSGEIARDMFIIADGVVEVISERGRILTQMSTGDFFGEIGILNLDGGINRRTADVRSVGYSELFVLSREDVLSALKDHPEAEGILIASAMSRLKASALHNAATFDPSQSPPIVITGEKEYSEDEITEQNTEPDCGRFTVSGRTMLHRFVLIFEHLENKQHEIIREYGHQRLKEVEAERRKDKAKPDNNEEDDDDIDENFLSVSLIDRNVRLYANSPNLSKSSGGLSQAGSDRRKSCSVDYYRPRPVNGLVNFLQRKLSAGSAFCSVYQQSQFVNHTRAHMGSGSHDPNRRTSSLASSVDSVSHDRDSVMKCVSSTNTDPAQKHPVKVMSASSFNSSKQGIKGLQYGHVSNEDFSDSESSVYGGSSFCESSKLLPVEESVNDETSPVGDNGHLRAPLASTEGNSSNSDGEIRNPCLNGHAEGSTKIANAFIEHLVRLTRSSNEVQSVGKRPLDRKGAPCPHYVVDSKTEQADHEQHDPEPKPLLPTQDSTDIFGDTVTSSSSTIPSSFTLDLTGIASDRPPLYSHVIGCTSASTEHNQSSTGYLTNLPHWTNSSDHGRMTPAPNTLVGLKTNGGRKRSAKERPENGAKRINVTSPTGSTSTSSCWMPSRPPSYQAPLEIKVDEMMGNVQGLIQQKLMEITDGYMSKVRVLEEENQEKEGKIEELETRLLELQKELNESEDLAKKQI